MSENTTEATEAAEPTTDTLLEVDTAEEADGTTTQEPAGESADETPEADDSAAGDDSEDDGDDADGDADGDDQDGDEEAATGGSKRTGRRGQLEREGEVAADFLETLLDICDLDGDLDVDIDGDRAAVALVDSDEGRVPRRLVGPDGQVLEALQELTRLAVQAETGERSRLMLDVAGHRAERRASLVTLAQEAIAGVKGSGEPASLAPMTAFERKVVHDEVLAAGLVSESEGAEPRRYVVISPA
ncbi:RNA-binding protein [Phycicoccus sp. HDW14]|uniref:Jag family protein n=1 Tax=Phycicoccus sp. HDW14 TaxID=2714941 RepID=UPI00140C4044|nr:R3H domain-containing nucleic acid-binding protein [Phycicoccus sp. HDW14]QIM22398.1 RNA-binding protein [Phycicoccus sp. HDW14]